MSYCETITEPISLKKLLKRIQRAKKNGDECIILDPEGLCPKELGDKLTELGYDIWGEPTSPDSWRVKIFFDKEKRKMDFLNKELKEIATLDNNFEEKLEMIKQLQKTIKKYYDKIH